MKDICTHKNCIDCDEGFTDIKKEELTIAGTKQPLFPKKTKPKSFKREILDKGGDFIG